MNKKYKIFKLLFLLTTIILCIALTTKEFQNDTFYTIKIGESIIQNGVDLIDHFSIHILTYSYPHWLYDVIIYQIYHLFNLSGIYISSIILYIILILSIYYINKKLTQNDILSIIVALISLFMVTPFITARAQLLSTTLLLYEVYFLEKLIQTKHKKYIFVLTLISLIIANTHVAVWPLYFVLYLPYLVENLIIYLPKTKLIQKLRKHIYLGLKSSNKKILIQHNSNSKTLLFSFILSLLMGFITPLKDIPFTYTIRTMLGNSQSYITEHLPLTPIFYPTLLILSALILIILTFTKTKIRLHDLFLLSGLSLMTLMSARHMFLLIVIGSISIARLLNNFLEDENDNTISQIVTTCTHLPITILILFLTLLYSYSTYNKNNVSYINNDIYPVEAANYIKDNLDINEIRLFNEYNYGSYLIYKNIPVFIDSRADLYLKEFNKDTTVFEDAVSLPDNYQEIFDNYKITHILLSKDNILNTILKLDTNYNTLYEDDNFIIFQKIESESNYEN